MNVDQRSKTISNLLSTHAGRIKLAQSIINASKRHADVKSIDIHEDYIIKLNGDMNTSIATKEFNEGNYLKETGKLPEVRYFSDEIIGNYYTINNKIMYIIYSNQSIKNYDDIQNKMLRDIYNTNIKCPKDETIIIDYEMINCLKRFYDNSILL